jgi:hypothetical protein
MTNRTQTPTSNRRQNRHRPTETSECSRRSIVPQNAIAIVVRANRVSLELGGHDGRKCAPGRQQRTDAAARQTRTASSRGIAHPAVLAELLNRSPDAVTHRLRGLRIAQSARDLPASPRARPPRQANKRETLTRRPGDVATDSARGSHLREGSRLLSARAGRARLSTRLPARAHESARSDPPTLRKQSHSDGPTSRGNPAGRGLAVPSCSSATSTRSSSACSRVSTTVYSPDPTVT